MKLRSKMHSTIVILYEVYEDFQNRYFSKHLWGGGALWMVSLGLNRVLISKEIINLVPRVVFLF